MLQMSKPGNYYDFFYKRYPLHSGKFNMFDFDASTQGSVAKAGIVCEHLVSICRKASNADIRLANTYMETSLKMQS